VPSTYSDNKQLQLYSSLTAAFYDPEKTAPYLRAHVTENTVNTFSHNFFLPGNNLIVNTTTVEPFKSEINDHASDIAHMSIFMGPTFHAGETYWY